jgi:hypothetical protein
MLSSLYLRVVDKKRPPPVKEQSLIRGARANFIGQ